jgi:hypothetical protein
MDSALSDPALELEAVDGKRAELDAAKATSELRLALCVDTVPNNREFSSIELVDLQHYARFLQEELKRREEVRFVHLSCMRSDPWRRVVNSCFGCSLSPSSILGVMHGRPLSCGLVGQEHFWIEVDRERAMNVKFATFATDFDKTEDVEAAKQRTSGWICNWSSAYSSLPFGDLSFARMLSFEAVAARVQTFATLIDT